MCTCAECGETVECGTGFGTHIIFESCGEHEDLETRSTEADT